MSLYLLFPYSYNAPNFSKGRKRDLTYMIKDSEAYRNIMRDNERYEFMNQFRYDKPKRA